MATFLLVLFGIVATILVLGTGALFCWKFFYWLADKLGLDFWNW